MRAIWDKSQRAGRWVWLRHCDARFIVRGLTHLYFKPDVDEARSKRAVRQAEKLAAKKPGKAKKAA